MERIETDQDGLTPEGILTARKGFLRAYDNSLAVSHTRRQFRENLAASVGKIRVQGGFHAHLVSVLQKEGHHELAQAMEAVQKCEQRNNQRKTS